jgi:dimethylargininase
VPIDAAKASAQHARYEQALRDSDFEVHRLPELSDNPDAVFVEDTALILGSNAVILRPGASSRAGETSSTAQGLAGHFELFHIERGHIDGGDILRIGTRLYVGLSMRTDEEGVEALTELVYPLGFEVVRTQLGNCLHLKTAATFAGPDAGGAPILLYDQASVDPSQFTGVEPLPVAPGERAAANCVRAGGHLIVPAGNRRTSSILHSRGFTIIEVDVSELQKAEAGVTCMSLIDERS